ncbi:thiol reductant ABC exporter subunit CydD [Arcanobacterium bovis]|uniref:Thiol reductant ABC exporter subunit CydD n=1 Tax=Arcanobacterium bovis TaxID=2529275 RepID=A0A4Q9V0A6_9ACTO|nr:thiol reductant ABC exporter subunit CydD [Arcanobacterium bovis]TBW22058.1 thiol reductant ABC exporter subunit CydD [Arcanobacterium bovis]
MRPFDPRLIKYAKETRSYILFLVLVGFVQTLLIATQTILLAAALSPIFYGTGTITDTAFYIAWIGIIFAIRAGLDYLQRAYGHRSAIRVISSLRTAVLDHSGQLGIRWLSEGNTARVVTLATRGLDDLEAYFVSFLPQLFLCVTTIPVLIAIIFYLDWLSAIAIVLCIPLIPIFMILIGKLTSKYSSQRLKSMQKLGTQLLDLLAGLSTLKALGREKGPRQRVKMLGEAFAEKTMQTLYVAFLSGAALEFLDTLSTAIVAVEIGFRMVGGNVLLFTGLVVIMLTPEVFKPLREVGTQFHASADGIAAAEQAFTILEEDLAPAERTTQCPDLSSSQISFGDLGIYAPGRATVAPAHLDAVIEPGSITILRGASGAGKTTAVHALLGMISPDEGEITVNSVPLSRIDLSSLWEQITWVPQRPVLVPGTILENLDAESLTSRPSLTSSSSSTVPSNASKPINSSTSSDTRKLENAAQQTGFIDVVRSLPDGWNTVIGQGGVGLSVGQRQRLALTRALLNETPLVILDEPSAHLDATSEEYVRHVIESLKAQGKTVLVIAHRAGLTKIADSVIEVQSASRNIDATLALELQEQRDTSVYAQAVRKIDYALPQAWENEGQN